MSFGLGTTSAFTATTSAPSFGFGTSTTTSKGTGFGGATGFTFGSQPSAFGTAPTTTTASSFGFGGFGGFPSTTTTASTTGMPSVFGGFNSFGTTTQPTAGSSLFPSSSGFGSFGGFGSKAATTTAASSFGGFGSLSFGTGLGQQQQQLMPQQQTSMDPAQSHLEAVYNAVFNCQVYGDERDSILAKWNLIQAMWGTGKGYYSQTAPPVEFTPHNPLCRFKAIGYSCIPGSDNKEGFVVLVFNKKDTEIRPQQAQLITSLNSILGNKPNVTAGVEFIKSISETKTQVVIYVQEKAMTGAVKKITATDLAAYLLQPMQKQQLTSLGVENAYPQVHPEKDQLNEYLQNPPMGIDPRLWKQARLDNPNPNKYIPIPIVGFEQVRWRMKSQEQETQLHQAFLDKVSEDIANLQRQQTTAGARIAEYRRRFVELEHRLLQLLVKQEITRKIGLAPQPEEEALRSRLEALQQKFNSHANYKAKLLELQTILLRAKEEMTEKEMESYTMDSSAVDDIKQFLVMEQNGMAHVIDTIQSDLRSLKVIKEGLPRLLLQGQTTSP